ncbi:MAG: hypothetical protein ACLR8L_00180 [Oscillospiraceae bacterium]
MGDFTPGMYLRDGYSFTSRGCMKECWFCSVPRCAHGVIRELPIVNGWNILDDNILGTSEHHFRAVCEMLKRQEHPAIFTGGLEPSLLQQWQADLLREVNQSGFTQHTTQRMIWNLWLRWGESYALRGSGQRATPCAAMFLLDMMGTVLRTRSCG